MERNMKMQICKYLVAVLLAISVLPAPAWALGYTQTKYPIVLVHGIFGFDNIGPIEYFYGIPSSLRSGGANVFVSQVSAANTNEVRGEQLLTYVKQVLAATGATKVNLIGHSQGSPTARYVASVRPDLVASVTSVGGVNKGSAVADVLIHVAPPGGLSSSVIASVGNGLAKLVNWLSGSPNLSQNLMGAETSLSTAGSLKFNVAHPEGIPTSSCGEGAYQVHGVSYFSWSGGSAYTNVFDIVDPFLVLTSLAFGGASNDGLVSSCSSHLGRVIRDNYGMNHLDEVNQVVGLVNIFETNPVTLYRQQANRLQGLGL